MVSYASSTSADGELFMSRVRHMPSQAGMEDGVDDVWVQSSDRRRCERPDSPDFAPSSSSSSSNFNFDPSVSNISDKFPSSPTNLNDSGSGYEFSRHFRWKSAPTPVEQNDLPGSMEDMSKSYDAASLFDRSAMDGMHQSDVRPQTTPQRPHRSASTTQDVSNDDATRTRSNSFFVPDADASFTIGISDKSSYEKSGRRQSFRMAKIDREKGLGRRNTMDPVAMSWKEQTTQPTHESSMENQDAPMASPVKSAFTDTALGQEKRTEVSMDEEQDGVSRRSAVQSFQKAFGNTPFDVPDTFSTGVASPKAKRKTRAGMFSNGRRANRNPLKPISEKSPPITPVDAFDVKSSPMETEPTVSGQGTQSSPITFSDSPVQVVEKDEDIQAALGIPPPSSTRSSRTFRHASKKKSSRTNRSRDVKSERTDPRPFAFVPTEQEGKPARRILRANSVKAKGPEWTELKKLGGKAYQQREYVDAADLYRQSLTVLENKMESDPDSVTKSLKQDKAKLHSNRAAALMMLMQLSEAQREAERSIGEDEQYTRAHLRLARIHVLQGEVVGARESLAKCRQWASKVPSSVDANDQASMNKVQLSVESLSGFLAEVKWATDVQDHATALQFLEKALAISPCSRSFQVQKAELLIEQKEYVQVVQYCDSILNRHRAHNQKLHRPNGALGEIERPDDESSGLNSEDGEKVDREEIGILGIDLSLFRSTSLYYQNKVEDAMKLLNALELVAPCSAKVIRVKHRWKDMQSSKQQANELYKQGEFQKAVTMYSQALHLDPMHDEYCAVIYCNRAAALMCLKRYQSALLDCDEALQRKPRYVKARLRRARCYVATGKYEKAVGDFDAYLEADVYLDRRKRMDVEREKETARKCWMDEREHLRHRREERRRQSTRKSRFAWEGTKQFDPNASYFFQESQRQQTPRRPRVEQKQTLYDVLGVKRDATSAQIKKQYRKLALQHHPDKKRDGMEVDEELFKAMTAAYTVLSDDAKRAQYDRQL